MSLDKSIAHGKEHRKPYRGTKAYDCTCRNHGSCQWCVENRTHKFRDKQPPEFDIDGDMNRKKKLFLTAEQIQIFGEDVEMQCEAVEIPSEWKGE